MKKNTHSDEESQSQSNSKAKAKANSKANSQDNQTTPSLSQAAKVWGKIGCLSFGGPAAQIALMHRLLVA